MGTICPVCHTISSQVVDIGHVSCNECSKQFFPAKEYDTFRIGKDDGSNWSYVCQECCNKAEEIHRKDFHESLEVI